MYISAKHTSCVDRVAQMQKAVNAVLSRLCRHCLTFGGSDGVEVPFLPPDSRRRVSYRDLEEVELARLSIVCHALEMRREVCSKGGRGSDENARGQAGCPTM